MLLLLFRESGSPALAGWLIGQVTVYRALLGEVYGRACLTAELDSVSAHGFDLHQYSAIDFTDLTATVLLGEVH